MDEFIWWKRGAYNCQWQWSMSASHGGNVPYQCYFESYLSKIVSSIVSTTVQWNLTAGNNWYLTGTCHWSFSEFAWLFLFVWQHILGFILYSFSVFCFLLYCFYTFLYKTENNDVSQYSRMMIAKRVVTFYMLDHFNDIFCANLFIWIHHHRVYR